MPRPPIAAAVVLLTLTACSTGASGAVDAFHRWDVAGVRDYVFHLRVGCSDAATPAVLGVPAGRFAVEVRDRHVVRVTGLDEAGRAVVAGPDVANVPSVSGLFQLQQDAAADGDRVEVRYSGDGHPAVLHIVTSPSDDRSPVACLRVTSYRPR